MMNKQQKNIPQLRFPGFEGEYYMYKLSKILTRYSEINKDEEFKIDDILSLSSIYGIVDRKELLEETYSKVNHFAYIKTRLNDFVYGKSISSNYPYGLFKANKCRDGLLSTLYFTFKVNNNAIPDYLDCYFSHLNRANNFLKKFVLVGDRYITADSDYLLSGEIYIPSLPEQTKIASFFTEIDRKIGQLKQKKTLLEQYKKGVMQQLFSQTLRFKDDNGNQFPKWEKKRLGEVLNISNGITKEQNDTPQGFKVTRIETISDGTINLDKVGYVDYINNIEEYKIKKGYILFSNINSVSHIGKTAIALTDLELYHGMNLLCLKCKNEINSLFIYYCLNSVKIRNYFKSICNKAVNQASINQTELSKTEINLPSIPEQTKISQFLSAIDDKINIAEKSLERIQMYKKGLLQQMFV